MVTFSTDIYTVEKKAAITSAFIVLALTSILPFLFFWGWYISFTNTILLGLFSICFFNLIYLPKLIFYKFYALAVIGICISIEVYPDFHSIINIDGLGGPIPLILLSTAFLFWPVKNRTGRTSAFFQLVVFLFNLVTIEGAAVSLLDLQILEVLLKITILPFIALIQFILGLGLICWNFYLDGKSKIENMKSYSIFFGVGVLVFHGLIILGLVYNQSSIDKTSYSYQPKELKVELDDKFFEIASKFHDFATKIQNQQELNFGSQKEKIEIFFKEEKALNNIYIFNNDFTLIESFFPNKAVINELQGYIKKEDGQELPYAIFSFFIPNEKKVFLKLSIEWNQKIQGYILEEIDLSEILRECKSIVPNKNRALEVRCENQILYSWSTLSDAQTKVIVYDEDLNVFGIKMHVQTKISEAETSYKSIQGIIFFLLLGGIGGGILTGIIIYLYQSLKSKMHHLNKVQNQLLMSNEILKVINQSTTRNEAIEKILSILYQFEQWEIFLFWKLDKKSKKLQLVNFNTYFNSAYTELEQVFKNSSESKNTLYQQVLEQKKIIWVTDYSQTNYSISEIAKKEGIKGVFALPVYVQRKIYGVIEILKKDSLVISADDEKISIMQALSNEFGAFIERQKASEVSEEFSILAKSSLDAIYKVDLELKIQSWNVGAENIYGWKNEEVIGQSISLIYPESRIDEMSKIKQELDLTKNVEHFVTQRKRKDNTIIWVENTYSTVLKPSGEIRGYFVISRDITREKENIDHIKSQEEKFRSFVESTQSWIWEMNEKGEFTFSNPASIRVLGYDPKEIVGMNLISFAFEKEKIEKDLQDQSSSPIGWKRKIWQAHSKNGKLVFLESYADPILNEQKKLIGFRGADRDVTEDIQVQKTKNEFISMVSHELRTPLTSIIGSLTLLDQNIQVQGETKELILMALRNSQRLLQLINDILDIEKISLGKIQLILKECDLCKIVEESLKTILPQAEEKKIVIIKNVPERQIKVNIDADRITQVILNLLSNAIKFSPTSSTIDLDLVLLDHIVRLQVKDQGIGIPYEYQGKIFEKFFQGVSGDIKTKGTGLGLHISKALIERMGGKIGFTSTPNQGSLFYFDLPYKKEEI